MSFGLAGAAFGQETISQMNEDELMIAVSLAADVMTKCGVGGCGGLILVAPIVLLFSYTRTHKNKKIDTLLPIIAIALIAFMYFEGFYHFILKAGNRLQEMLQSLLGGGGGA